MAGLEKLLRLSKEHGLTSEVYIKACQKGDPDFSYDAFSPEVSRCVGLVREMGMVAGFHGGLSSHHDAGLFGRQKEALETAIEQPILHGRQHYLLFDPLRSPQVWEEGGLEYDSTIGYPDREGFAVGTCHPYHLYDFKRGGTSGVTERPLIAMDVTLRYYRSLRHDEALAQLVRLQGRARTAEGDFIVLWHNLIGLRNWYGWFQNVYRMFIESVAVSES